MHTVYELRPILSTVAVEIWHKEVILEVDYIPLFRMKCFDIQNLSVYHNSLNGSVAGLQINSYSYKTHDVDTII